LLGVYRNNRILALAAGMTFYRLLAIFPALVALTLSLAFIYRYGPSRDVSQWRWVSWGSAFAALLWLVASAAFSWYAANFGTNHETYGSLDAAIGFMTWLWISSIAVLIGAEVDAAMERRPFSDASAALKLN
jgi:membrane protein